MSYLEYFGLSSEPFSNAPVSRFYYDAPQHQQALTRLLYAASSMKGLAVLVGDIGAGKTTLARRLLDSLPEEEYEAALLVIIHSGITAGWLLKRIAMQLGVENPAQEKLALLSQLYQRLLQIYEQGRKAVVLIDEAQMLETRELMEEFRGLLNLEVPERKLISFVFFGLPEIEQNLKLDPPLAQRVAMRYRLESFSADSTEAYIKHRLRLAGSAKTLFSPDAIQAVHRRSKGTPRVINTLCDNALFEAFLARTQEISGAMIEQIAENLGLEANRGVGAPPAASPAPAPMPPKTSVTLPVDVSEPGPAPVSAPTAGSSVPAAHPTAMGAGALGTASRLSAQTQLRAVAPPAPPAPAVTPVKAPYRSSVSTSSHLDSAPAASEPLPAPPAAATAGSMASEAGDPRGAGPPPGAPIPAPPPSAPTKPKPAVDLAEIDRYLEGLGKL
jgi:type II secretory pathway predicted ATPase ExeA